jgi:hypothetical protein
MNEDLSISLDNHRTLWLTEISRSTYEDQALDELGGDGGVFVVLEDTAEGTFEVLAKAASIWAGAALLDLFARSMTKSGQVITVEHNAKDGWHEFTCHQVPGFHLVSQDADLERAYAEVPDAIGEIIEADEGTPMIVES